MATHDLQAQIDNLIRIGIALSSERDLDVLLEMIVDESRRFTQADGGTLYIVSDDGKLLNWMILQTDSIDFRVGGTSEKRVEDMTLPLVQLVVDGQMNQSNVSAYVANTGHTVNIPDVYEAEGYDFAGTRGYDQNTGYRSKSMLVIPMRNHEDDIIGVLQLLNATDPETGEVIPFAPEYEAMISSLASQAAVAITNVRLIQDLRDLFEGFIKTIADAIDEKSTYTGGHIRRVTQLTMMIAREINRTEEGLWGKVHFTDDELEELRIAAWMHDVGKITQPEYVVDKASKLETIYDRIETVRMRYEVLKRDAEIAAQKKKVDLLTSGPDDAEKLANIDSDLAKEVDELREEFEFVARANTGREYLEDEDLARLRKAASRTFEADGRTMPALNENEMRNLEIRMRTLTEEEHLIIQNHAVVGARMLDKLPFSKKLKRVPEYAGGHHEKLSGKGYPRKLTADQLPLQARIMAVADIFEAITASDRPYKKPNSLSQAIKILGFMANDNELDAEIVELFRKSGLAMEYARKEIKPDLIDIGEEEIDAL